MPSFRAGETLLSSRYRLVRFLAQGGMGEVWEAFDLELKSRVALKVLRREIASDQVALERFRREVALSRRVSHPSVCRIFELGKDEETGAVFLTMELLEGVTLERRIAEGGPLPHDEALAIARQLCEGLAAAHRAGVLHRDLKSANVILAETAGGHRAVITDFGLARALLREDAASATLTADGFLVGTPAYMSPEQAEGSPVGPASDIYALGVLLYEMVTGRFPHSGSTPLAVLLSRLKGPAPSPLTVMPQLDARWDAVIRRCLEAKPSRRFTSADDVVKALDGEWVAPAPPEPEPAVAPPARRSRRVLLVAGGIALGIAVVGALFLRHVNRVAARRSAAVLGLKDLSGRPETAWLSTALAEMLTAELAKGEHVRAVPGETVARVKVELGLAESEGLSPETLARVSALLGSELVVTGSYAAASADAAAPLHVSLRVQGRDGTDERLEASGTPGGAIALASSLGRALRHRLGLPERKEEAAGAKREDFPENPSAQRFYAEGLAALRRFELVEACRLLERAADDAPKNARIRSALAAAYGALGNDRKAREAARAAFERSEGLPREERLLVEAQLAEAEKDWPRAIDGYKTLVRFFPDDVEHALRLARAQVGGGRAGDALATVMAVGGSDPRLPMRRAEAELALARYREALASARRCREEAEHGGARMIAAEGALFEGSALLRLGEQEAARTSLERARRTFAALGDRNAEAFTLNRIANVDFELGDYPRARENYGRAEALWRSAGNRRGEGSALGGVASSWFAVGAYGQALPILLEAIDAHLAVGDLPTLSLARINLAIVALRTGDTQGAIASAREAARIAREASYPYGLAPALEALAQAQLARRAVPEARAAVEEALGIARGLGDPRILGMCLRTLGDVEAAAGDRNGARRSYQEAFAAQRATRLRHDEVETLTALGAFELEARPREAAESLREALRLAKALSLPDEEMLASALLARATRGTEESMAAAERARNRLPETEDVLKRARVQAALDSLAQSPP